MTQTTKSEQETKQLAIDMASELKGGEILALSGELGAGKTTFVKGIAEYFHMADEVSSPTFTLIQEYGVDNSKYPIFSLIHIDCYRLDNEEELIEIGVQEYLDEPDSVVIIEWAEKIKSILPKKTAWIKFQHGDSIDERIISKS